MRVLAEAVSHSIQAGHNLIPDSSARLGWAPRAAELGTFIAHPSPQEPPDKQAAPERDGEHLQSHGWHGKEGGILANDRALILITGLFAFK